MAANLRAIYAGIYDADLRIRQSHQAAISGSGAGKTGRAARELFAVRVAVDIYGIFDGVHAFWRLGRGDRRGAALLAAHDNTRRTDSVRRAGKRCGAQFLL